MKKSIFTLLLVITVSLFNCSSDDDATPSNEDIPEATLLGRWVIVGFEETIRYEFTESKRFDIYSDDGTFPTLEEFNAQNPLLTGLDWYFEGDNVTIDLNFGNFSTLTPEFVCDNYAIRWINEDGEIHSIYYREGYDISGCSDIN